MASGLRWSAEQLQAAQARLGRSQRIPVAVAPISEADTSKVPGVDIDRVHRKYRNTPTVDAEGIRHDSKREAKRWTELRALLRAGEIVRLARQVSFLLPGGVLYIADFVYRTKDGAEVVEDAKGLKTAAYGIKKRQLRAVHGIEIREV